MVRSYFAILRHIRMHCSQTADVRDARDAATFVLRTRQRNIKYNNKLPADNRICARVQMKRNQKTTQTRVMCGLLRWKYALGRVLYKTRGGSVMPSACGVKTAERNNKWTKRNLPEHRRSTVYALVPTRSPARHRPRASTYFTHQCMRCTMYVSPFFRSSRIEQWTHYLRWILGFLPSALRPLLFVCVMYLLCERNEEKRTPGLSRIWNTRPGECSAARIRDTIASLHFKATYHLHFVRECAFTVYVHRSPPNHLYTKFIFSSPAVKWIVGWRECVLA